eukprot:scaffold19441_cov129-Isochrysis_galbana.AAC.5
MARRKAARPAAARRRPLLPVPSLARRSGTSSAKSSANAVADYPGLPGAIREPVSKAYAGGAVRWASSLPVGFWAGGAARRPCAII